MLPLSDDPLLLATVFFITFVVEKRNPWPCLLNLFTTASRKQCGLLNSWIVVIRKNLMMTKSRLSFFIHAPRNTFKIIYIMVTTTLIWTPWKTSRISSKATTMPIHPKIDKQNDWNNNKVQSSCCNCVVFTPSDNCDTTLISTTPSNCCSYD